MVGVASLTAGKTQRKHLEAGLQGLSIGLVLWSSLDHEGEALTVLPRSGWEGLQWCFLLGCKDCEFWKGCCIPCIGNAGCGGLTWAPSYSTRQEEKIRLKSWNDMMKVAVFWK